LCNMCWTRGHRVPDCKILTVKQSDIVQAARNTFLRQRNWRADSAQDRVSVVALLWDDLLRGVVTTKEDGGDAPPVAAPSKWRREAGNAEGGWPRHRPESPLYDPTPRLSPDMSLLPPRA